MRFAQLNCLATLAALAIFAVGIAAVVVDWYSYSEEYTINVSDGTNLRSGMEEGQRARGREKKQKNVLVMCESAFENCEARERSAGGGEG